MEQKCRPALFGKYASEKEKQRRDKSGELLFEENFGL